MSAFTQSDHVFLGLPRTLEPVTSKLVTDVIQDEDRTTCPYRLRHLKQLSPPVSPDLHTTNQWRFHHGVWRHRYIGSLICYMDQIVNLIYIFKLKPGPWPWHVTSQNVQLQEIHMPSIEFLSLLVQNLWPMLKLLTNKLTTHKQTGQNKPPNTELYKTVLMFTGT